jgi:MYXO-CTERM domain-containing protein
MKLSAIAIIASACAAVSGTLHADVVKVVSFTDLAEWHDAPTNPDLGLFPSGWTPVFNTETFAGVSVPGAQASISGGAGWYAWTASGSTKDGVVSKGSGIAAAAMGESVNFTFSASDALPLGGVRGIGGGFQFFGNLGNFVPGKIWLKLSTGDSMIKTIASSSQFMGFWVVDPTVTITSIRIQPLGTAATTSYVGVSTLYMGSMVSATPAPGAVALLGVAGLATGRRRRNAG